MKRMYSNEELVQFLKENSETIVEALKNKDLSIAGLTSKGIANTGGFANIGDVAISGNLSVQGEEKGIITCNALIEEYDTDLIDLSEYVNDTEVKSHSLYAKMKVKHGLLMIVVSGVFVTNAIASALNLTLLKNFYSLLPEAIRSKIYRSDRTNLTENPTQANYSNFVAGMVAPRSNGSTQTSNQAVVTSSESNKLELSVRGFPSMSEDTSVFIDCRFILAL